MKGIFPGVILWTLAVSAAATGVSPAVDRIINQVDPAINISIAVVDLNTGAVLYQRNPSRALIPASNMKLFSDAAALMVLGPDYRFQSQLSTNAATLDNGTLKGSLYLHLPGDPSFSRRYLAELFTQLSLWNIKRIQGNVVLVSHNHAVNAYPPGWMHGDLKYGYGAPVAPVVMDENRLNVTVNPGHKAGGPAIVELGEQQADFIVDNQVKTAVAGKQCGIDFGMDTENRLTVRGCVAIGQWAVQQKMAIRNPLRYAQSLVKQELAHLAIELDGNVILGGAPKGSFLLASHASKPVSQLLADTLKPSDNLYADSLYLHAAAKLNGSPLNWAQAEPVVKHFLQQQTGISLQNAMLTDGSGLSRNDLLSAEQTVGLLQFLHNRFPLAYEYIAALPIAGFDGTLQKRFRKPNQQGLLRAKTGTMTGVISLSGYLYTANGHTLAFAIFINSRPKVSPNISGRYRSLVDTLCAYFLQQKPNQTRSVTHVNPHGRVAFQQHPTQADLERLKKAKWRQFEYALKQAVKGEPITVLFRDDQLVLKDETADINRVWTLLQSLRKKYSFAVALEAKSAPIQTGISAVMLLVKPNGPNKPRIWTLREAIS